MADIYDSSVLVGVVRNLLGVPQFLLDRYFGAVQTESSEEIHFDVEEGKRRIAPFVSPLVEGQIVASQGYKTSVFTPAYIKDKRVVDMNRPFRRSAGEAFGGDRSPAERLRAHIANELADQRNMIDRRLEVMAALVLCNGKILIEGEKYPPVMVDFGRLGTHTIVAAPLWSDPNSKPLDNLATWGGVALQDSGVMMTDVIMPPNVWSVFRNNTQVKDNIMLYRTLAQPPSLLAGQQMMPEGGTYVGTVDTWNIFVYAGWYVDPKDNLEKQIWPANKIAMVSPQMQGVRAFGAIRDERAGLQAMPYYPKSWIQEDPSVRFMLMQSAPLLVPYRPNATLSAQVL
jgi:Phage major capsid protein E